MVMVVTVIRLNLRFTCYKLDHELDRLICVNKKIKIISFLKKINDFDKIHQVISCQFLFKT
jgi:hypothetical protein